MSEGQSPKHTCAFCWLDSRTAGDEETTMAASFLLGALAAPTVVGERESPPLCPEHFNAYLLAFGALLGTLTDDTPSMVLEVLKRARVHVEKMPAGPIRETLKRIAHEVEEHEKSLTEEERLEGWILPNRPN